LVVGYGGGEEIDYVRMVLVHRPIAGDIERRIAGSVFAEFVAPEVAVRRALADPVFVHVRKEVELAEGRKEGADAMTRVRWDRSAGGGAGCGIW
jgi:hypothetical protein